MAEGFSVGEWVVVSVAVLECGVERGACCVEVGCGVFVLGNLRCGVSG